MGKFAMYKRRGSSVGGTADVVITAVIGGGSFDVSYLFGAVIATSAVDWSEFVCDGINDGVIADGGQPGDNFVTLEYSQIMQIGDAWEVTNTPAGLTFAGGNLLKIPQAGVLI